MYEQDRVYVRLQQRVLQDAAIRVCFVSGSFGRGAQDAYSDLDVALVFESDAARKMAFERRHDFVQSVMPYVTAKSFDAEHIRPYFHIALYANGTKVDYRFETSESLEPNPWDREIRLLKDDNGWGEAFRQKCASLPFPRPAISSQQLAEMDQRFWVMFWDTFRQVQRGDHEKPFPVYIQLFTLTLLPIMELLPQENSARQALFNAYFSQDAAATLDHLKRLLPLYLDARRALIKHLDLFFKADNTFENSILRLVERA
jgi:predicted nucleotidyltransferase